MNDVVYVKYSASLKEMETYVLNNPIFVMVASNLHI